MSVLKVFTLIFVVLLCKSGFGLKTHILRWGGGGGCGGYDTSKRVSNIQILWVEKQDQQQYGERDK